MKKRILQIGDPDLRLTCNPITDFEHSDLKMLITNLKDTMYDTGLVGIAAPQIGQNFQVFITHPRSTTSRILVKEDNLRIFINPQIQRQSSKQTVMYEGCGSVAKGELFGPVKRPTEITVTAFDENMQSFTLTCDGLLARVIQHEIDHLEGIEFLQRITDTSNIIDGTIYRKTIRNSKKQQATLRITKLKIQS